MNERAAQHGCLVGVGLVFRDLSGALSVALPSCKVPDDAGCRCNRHRVIRSYDVFLNRLTEAAKESAPT